MSSKTVIVAVLAAVGMGILAFFLYDSQVELRRESVALREQSVQLARMAADNQRLSNSLAEAGRAQAIANEQLQELIRLRTEVNRLRDSRSQAAAPETNTTIDIATELAILRDEVDRLSLQNEELARLREELEALRTEDLSSLALEPLTGEPEDEEPSEGPLGIRVIRTRADTFAEKLKQSVAARDDESFQAVFGRFLHNHGVQTNGVAGAVYDERTGSVIVRATPAALDQVERITSALDQEP